MSRALVVLLCSLSLAACEFHLPLASSTPELVTLGAALPRGMGGEASLPSLQLGADGEPVVAYVFRGGEGARALHVMRWTGEAWTPAAPPLPVKAWCPQLRLDPAGHPVVAFLSQQEALPSIAVFRWTGEAWETLAERLQVGSGERGYECPALALGPSGEPVVASVGYDRPISFPTRDSTHVHVHRWTGSGWEQLGEQLNTHGGVSGVNTVALSTDSRGRPVVAWAERIEDGFTSELRVARWETGSWHALGGAQGQRVYAPELVVDAQDRPVVAWVQEPSGFPFTSGALRVARLEQGRWVSLGDEVRARPNPDGVGSTSLALDAQGTPWMAWRESGDADIYIQLARWTGWQWERVAQDMRSSSQYMPNGPSPAHPSLAVDSHGRPVVAWEEGLIHVRRARQ
jgi:hypothetical protein